MREGFARYQGAGLGMMLFAALLFAPPAAATIPDGPGGGSKDPAVKMERALLAAQLDPAKSGTGVTPGAKTSVLRVERALRARGLLARKYVDGHFGSSTRTAYTKWQQRLGYSGPVDANGLPGKTSLRKLGKNRFRVTRVVKTGRVITLPLGEKLNKRTNKMKVAASSRLKRDCDVVVIQGSYSDADASAGTHQGGGALDISVTRGCGTRHPSLVKALRTVGFAAWYRPDNPGVWDPHIHAIAVNDPSLHTAARDQVGDYYQGRNGLEDNGPDPGPDVRKITWEQYKREQG